ncbi:MAG: TRAP transporter large permease [Brucellaceae bacterium]|nr:TRAP transporter large permease [Brucellaceae bacterium]
MIFLILAMLLLLGVPVAFSLGLSSMIMLMLSGYPLSIVALRMTDGLNSFALVALPLFMLSGALMAHGCTPRIVRFVNMLFGRTPGGLGSVTIASCTFFSAVSGSGSATVAAIGGVTAKDLMRQNYTPGYVASMLAAAGGLGILIPPSIPLVIYGISAQVSISRLFAAGIVPGFLIGACLIGYNTFVAKRRGFGLTDRHGYTSSEVLAITLDALLPLGMPLVVVGGVMAGIFTPTEASVAATVYAFVLTAFIYRELTPRKFLEACKDAMTASTMILFVIACANAFAWYLTIENISGQMAAAFVGFSDNGIVVMLMITALLLLLGTFMETSAVVLITTPILLPIVVALGFDPVHYGILLIVNLIVGAMTPPLAVTLFISTRLCGIEMQDTFPDILYLIGLYVVVLLVLTFVPAITMWLPGLIL